LPRGIRAAQAQTARFYEYSLGSARESRDWYFKGRHVLSETVFQHRLQFLSEIIRLLLTMVPQQRGRILRDDSTPYQANADAGEFDFTLLDHLSQSVPLPEP